MNKECSCNCKCGNDKVYPEGKATLIRKLLTEVEKTTEKYWLCSQCFKNEYCYKRFMVKNLELSIEYLTAEVLTEEEGKKLLQSKKNLTIN